MRQGVMEPKVRLSNGNMSLGDAMSLLAEGSVEALTVLRRLPLATETPAMIMLDLDDMGIYGEAIWLAFGRCSKDLDRFVMAIKDRDIEKLTGKEQINRGRQQGGKEKKEIAPSKYIHPKAVRPRCSTCGLKLRGPNHDQGGDHQKAFRHKAKA